MAKKRDDIRRTGYKTKKDGGSRRDRVPFVVGFGCLSCGHTWSVEYTKYDRLKDGDKEVILLYNNGKEEDKGASIKCPECGGSSVKAKSRKGLIDRKSES